MKKIKFKYNKIKYILFIILIFVVNISNNMASNVIDNRTYIPQTIVIEEEKNNQGELEWGAQSTSIPLPSEKDMENYNNALQLMIQNALLDVNGISGVKPEDLQKIGFGSRNNLQKEDGYFYDNDKNTTKKFEKGELIGSFKLTGYCPCAKCNGRYSTTTYSGATTRVNHTVATDKTVIPMGTYIIMEGASGDTVHLYDGLHKAEDIGGGVKGNHLDVFCATHEEARQVTNKGYQYANVYLAKLVE
ncbi:MAG: 3D domain-containing protein [Eubacteriales bacterium]|nr:3D domain-containing protein [Eubacteriales bacterium]